MLVSTAAWLLGSILLVCSSNRAQSIKYTADWKSLDSRPLPKWYDQAKVGIFVHWGLFSVPAFHSEWFWFDLNNAEKENSSDVVDFVKRNYPPNFSYPDFASQFTADLFDPDRWAKLFKQSGAQYVVLTSKHHDGFVLWPSKYSQLSWRSVDVGPKRDLVGELAQAVRNHNLTFGLYHSLMEWYNPLYLADKHNGFQSNDFVKNKILPEMKELINEYTPDVLW